MAEDAYQALRAQLGGDAPRALRQLSDADLRDLSAAIAEARRRQAHALAEAGERALGHVPRLLRGPIRKVVG